MEEEKKGKERKVETNKEEAAREATSRGRKKTSELGELRGIAGLKECMTVQPDEPNRCEGMDSS